MSERFDELAKAIARGQSRRTALKRLAGGVLGGALVLVGVREASAQDADPAGKKCRREGHPCEGNQVCCPGLVCRVTGPGNAQRCARPGKKPTTTTTTKKPTTTTTTKKPTTTTTTKRPTTTTKPPKKY